MNKFTVIVLCFTLVIASVFLLGMGLGPQGQGQRGGGPMGPGQMGQGQNQIFNQGMQAFGNQQNNQNSNTKILIYILTWVFRIVVAVIGLVQLGKIARSLDYISRNLPRQNP